MPPPSPPPAPETGSDGHLIGVDVGGTKVAVATLEDEALSSPTLQPTEATSADGLVDEIVAAVEAARNPRTQAVGVGVPSVVDFQSGHVRSSVNLHMEDFDLRGVLQDRLGLPVFVDNDANVAMLAEHLYGAATGTTNALMLTVGTGIGGGLIVNGEPYRGTIGAGAELGHTVIEIDGPPCQGNCPGRGHLETLA